MQLDICAVQKPEVNFVSTELYKNSWKPRKTWMLFLLAEVFPLSCRWMVVSAGFHHISQSGATWSASKAPSNHPTVHQPPVWFYYRENIVDAVWVSHAMNQLTTLWSCHLIETYLSSKDFGFKSQWGTIRVNLTSSTVSMVVVVVVLLPLLEMMRIDELTHCCSSSLHENCRLHLR